MASWSVAIGNLPFRENSTMSRVPCPWTQCKPPSSNTSLTVANQVLSQLSYRPLVENRDEEARRVPSYLNTAPRLVVPPTNTRCGVSRHTPTLPPASTTNHSAGRTVTAPNAPHSADSPAPAVNPYSSVVSP